MKYSYLLLGLIIWVCSCKPVDPYQYDVANFIELKKDPCFGFCPVYIIKINGKGEATFNGEKNISKQGTWYRRLSAKETNQLFRSFEKADFWAFDEEYTAQVTDLPTTWVTLVMADQSKTVKDYYGAPEELKLLEAMVEQIAEEDDQWKRELSGK